MRELQPLIIINAVGLTADLVSKASPSSTIAPLAGSGGAKSIAGVFPGLTLPAQATMLTGLAPGATNASAAAPLASDGRDSLSRALWQSQQQPTAKSPAPVLTPGHGVVANGWHRPDLGEVRFWSQARQQIHGETLAEAAKRLATARGASFTSAHLFWWFAQGSNADFMATPKPHYGADGSKAFDILTTPSSLAAELVAAHGKFPFPAFWGPMSGTRSSEWIANAAATTIRKHRPTLSLVYLPHLDYDLQRFGPSGLGDAGQRRLVAELDASITTIADAAKSIGAKILVLSEYGIVDVTRPVLPNIALRRAGLLAVRHGPFGEMLDTMASHAFAVCDHQIAHVYCRDEAAREKASEILAGLPGVHRVLDRARQADLGMAHANGGDQLLLAETDAWFAYPYWLDDRHAPDFARTIDIHRKPGYDPCELFFDPKRMVPKLRFAAKLALKKLGFRALIDVIPLDPSLVKGSHGLPTTSANAHTAGPVVLSDSSDLRSRIDSHADMKQAVLDYFSL